MPPKNCQDRLYKTFFSEFFIPVLRGPKRRRISYTGKRTEVRTAGTYSDAKHPESLCPRWHKIPRVILKLFLSTFPKILLKVSGQENILERWME